MGTCAIPDGKFVGGVTAQLYSQEIAVLAALLRSDVVVSENAIPRFAFTVRRSKGLSARGMGAAKEFANREANRRAIRMIAKPFSTGRVLVRRVF